MGQKIYVQVYQDWFKNKKLLSEADAISWISQNRNRLTWLVNLLKQVLHNDEDGEKFHC